MFSVAALGRAGIGVLLANPCGELRCFIGSPFSSENSVGVSVTSACLGLHQLIALCPKVLQVPFLLVKIPPSAQILMREGGKSTELVEPSLLGCCFHPRVPVPAGHGAGSKWVTGFCSPAWSQSQFLQKISQSWLSGHSDVLLCLDSCLGWKMFSKEKSFNVFCTIDRPKEKQG